MESTSVQLQPPANSTIEAVPPGRGALPPSSQPEAVGHGRPFGPNRLVVHLDRPVPYPPFGTGRSLCEGDLDLDAEELIEGVKKLMGAQTALLDVDDIPVLVVEDGHR
jgi:hypothetical protein